MLRFLNKGLNIRARVSTAFLHHSRRRKLFFLSIAGLFLALGFLHKDTINTELGDRLCLEPHSAPDGGDCQVFGEPRRPRWACYSAMRSSVPKFLKIYEQRPIRKNEWGMRLDHSFALWYILRQLQPKTVIESGAHNGHGTWIIRQALPQARIISIDPNPPFRRLPGVEYLVQNDFVDISQVDWVQRGVGVERTLVFIDDHHDMFKRMFTHNRHGFRHFIIEDNYLYKGGDGQSLKWVCETKRGEEWPGHIKENWNQKENMTWSEHLKQARKFEMAVGTYYEFPPLAPSNVMPYPGSHPAYRSPSIFRDKASFDRHLAMYTPYDFKHYFHLAYAEIRPEYARFAFV